MKSYVPNQAHITPKIKLINYQPNEEKKSKVYFNQIEKFNNEQNTQDIGIK